MGRITARSFYGLDILVFALCFMKVLSAQSTPTKNIIDVIKNDTKLCEVPKFLYESNIIQECRNVSYPDPDLTFNVDFSNRLTVLCLAFYDTLYKYCQMKDLKEPFKDKATFDQYIEKFFPNKFENNRTTFCISLKNLTFSYEKLKFALQHFKIDNSIVCYGTCFNMEGQFAMPLCRILAWSKSIDDEMKKINKEDIEAHSAKLPANVPVETQVNTQNADSKISSDKINMGKAGNNVENVNEAAEPSSVNIPKETLKSINKDKLGNEIDKNKSVIIKADSNNSQQLNNNNDNDNDNDNDNNNDNNNDNDNDNDNGNDNDNVNDNDNNSVPSNVQAIGNDKDISVTLQKPVNSDANFEAQNEDDTNLNIANTVTKANENDIIDEKNTISENTQDHENSANQEEWSQSGVEDEKLVKEVNEEQSNDAVDQRQTIPRYHNIRTDEESHFFTYFTIISLVSIAVYIGYHNKQKILAIVLEGRRSRSNRSRRRPSTANYRKLDCTLEEAVTSQCNANVTHVIY